MGLKVVSCNHDNTQGTVVLESDNPEGGLAIEELKSADARQIAILASSRSGLPDPRINGNVATYPVDSSGEIVENPKTQKAARYRGEVPLTRRLV